MESISSRSPLFVCEMQRQGGHTFFTVRCPNHVVCLADRPKLAGARVREAPSRRGRRPSLFREERRRSATFLLSNSLSLRTTKSLINLNVYAASCAGTNERGCRHHLDNSEWFHILASFPTHQDQEDLLSYPARAVRSGMSAPIYCLTSVLQFAEDADQQRRWRACAALCNTGM